MGYLLVIFSIVAYSPTSENYGHPLYDWWPIGEFKNEAACVQAARQMGMRGGDRFRCLPTDITPSPKGQP